MHFQAILALHYEFFKLGGGGQNDMFAPQYFHWGATAPPPPGSTPLSLPSFITEITESVYYRLLNVIIKKKNNGNDFDRFFFSVLHCFD